jgi:hypothetical protein
VQVLRIVTEEEQQVEPGQEDGELEGPKTGVKVRQPGPLSV